LAGGDAPAPGPEGLGAETKVMPAAPFRVASDSHGVSDEVAVDEAGLDDRHPLTANRTTSPPWERARWALPGAAVFALLLTASALVSLLAPHRGSSSAGKAVVTLMGMSGQGAAAPTAAGSYMQAASSTDAAVAVAATGFPAAAAPAAAPVAVATTVAPTEAAVSPAAAAPAVAAAATSVAPSPYGILVDSAAPVAPTVSAASATPAASASSAASAAPVAPATTAPPAAPAKPAVPPPCGGPGGDCRLSKCCMGEGMQCYEKNHAWASCKRSCSAGKVDKHDPDPSPWTCKTLGKRTPIKAGCSWAGEDCGKTKCCNNLGFVCAAKDASFSGCVQTVKKTTWVTQHIPMPAGWNGKIVGGGRSEKQAAPAAAGHEAGTTLFCFVAILPGSQEEALDALAKKNKLGIYACDGHAIFHSFKSGKAGWDTGTTTLVNTDVFAKIWREVADDGRYLRFDWTVKADADCVFFPDRLRSHLAVLKPPADAPLYVKNNAMDPGLGNNGFLGAIEVFSQAAVLKYSDNAEGCLKTLGTNAGEDGFMKGCMDALGVEFIWDKEMMFPDHAAGACMQKKRAAFHPLKDPKEWQHCVDIGTGKVPW